MAATPAHRRYDLCTGHACYPPRPNPQGSPNVFTNNRCQIRQSADVYLPHCCGPPCHVGVVAQGSPTVYVNELQMARIGDPVSCGSAVGTGSPNVFVGP